MQARKSYNFLDIFPHPGVSCISFAEGRLCGQMILEIVPLGTSLGADVRQSDCVVPDLTGPENIAFFGQFLCA